MQRWARHTVMRIIGHQGMTFRCFAARFDISLLFLFSNTGASSVTSYVEMDEALNMLHFISFDGHIYEHIL